MQVETKLIYFWVVADWQEQYMMCMYVQHTQISAHICTYVRHSSTEKKYNCKEEYKEQYCWILLAE